MDNAFNVRLWRSLKNSGLQASPHQAGNPARGNSGSCGMRLARITTFTDPARHRFDLAEGPAGTPA
jgi:hypothetical protein